ncbi:hypothetical protein EZI54_07995 [Marinobacter halodurans]|uniref:Uncharacterized protein n=1 Tax=Marinobacter halodurans TaxID=2528979 RepID=A0ABY1ZM68_9GAMM|nr:hypothetical protein EZI54_07995 [Marinobacter halodurans]
MKLTLKACGRAMMAATINAGLALVLMLLVEFAISGGLHLAEAYLYAGLLIWIVVFSGQMFRQYRLCQCQRHGHHQS